MVGTFAEAGVVLNASNVGETHSFIHVDDDNTISVTDLEVMTLLHCVLVGH